MIYIWKHFLISAGYRRPTDITTLWSNKLKRVMSQSKNIDPNTNVIKDVILFKYENPKFFKYMNIFGVTQFIFWSYTGQFAYNSLKNIPVNNPEESLPWWQKINLGEGKYKNTIAVGSLLFAWCVLAGCWMYTLRTVRFLILNKGGEKLSIVTYTPFGQNRIITVPLKNVSCAQSRHAAKIQLPMKVQNKYFYYILDMKGEFKNPQLFDYTAGMHRKLTY